MRLTRASQILLILSILGLCSVLILAFRGGHSTKWKLLTEGSHSHIVPCHRIHFFDSKNGLCVTTVSLEKTSDGGRTWSTALAYDRMGLYSMAFTSDKVGWIVGTEPKASDAGVDGGVASSKNHAPLVLKTVDGGLNWQRVNIDETTLAAKGARFSSFSDLCFGGADKVWLVGDGGVVEASTSETGMRIDNVRVTESGLNSVACGESGEVWAVSDDGTVMHLKDGWTERVINKNAFFIKVKVIESELWLAGGVNTGRDTPVKGLLLRSRNKGQTWEDKTPPASNSFFDLYGNGKQGWLIGAAGAIYHTSDGGQSWQRESAPTTNDLLTIFFLDRNRGWVGGDRFTVLGLAE